MKVIVIIPAAGFGTRMSAISTGNKSKTKQFFELQGTPILFHTLRKFANNSQIDEIVVALRKNETAGFLKLAEAGRVQEAAPGGRRGRAPAELRRQRI